MVGDSSSRFRVRIIGDLALYVNDKVGASCGSRFVGHGLKKHRERQRPKKVRDKDKKSVYGVGFRV
jgi:hypothetical protein